MKNLPGASRENTLPIQLAPTDQPEVPLPFLRYGWRACGVGFPAIPRLSRRAMPCHSVGEAITSRANTACADQQRKKPGRNDDVVTTKFDNGSGQLPRPKSDPRLDRLDEDSDLQPS